MKEQDEKTTIDTVINSRMYGDGCVRSKFALALSICKPLTGFLRVGYKQYACKQTAFNAAMSYILSNAIIGTYPNYKVDFSKVLVSRGSLTGSLNGVATYSNGVVVVNWDDNSGSDTANATDEALIAVLNTTREECIFNTSGTQRNTTNKNITVPADWAGESVEVFLGFITEDGKDVASSSYLGSITLP